MSLILHGSTAALNTLLEGKGVRIGLLTTRGFRDVYEIGRQWRGEDVFNIFAPAPKMLLTARPHLRDRRAARLPAARSSSRWRRTTSPRAARKLVADGVEAIAVCFLFAYANPAHEQAAAEIIRAHRARSLRLAVARGESGVARIRAHRVDRRQRLYRPAGRRAICRRWKSCRCGAFRSSRALMMKSDGGAASARMLARTPIQTVMSGPVAGVIGGRHLGDVKGIDNLITFDTGGTSSDMAVLPGQPLFKSEVTVARHPLRTHTVDIETIGAGGGSIASVQLGGVLKVGPQSAGADPGPACYGRGGSEPTLTDALVLLGHLNPDALLDGAMPISQRQGARGGGRPAWPSRSG